MTYDEAMKLAQAVNDQFAKLMETKLGELVQKAAKWDLVTRSFWEYFDALEDRSNFLTKHLRFAEDIRAIMTGKYPREFKRMESEDEVCPFCKEHTLRTWQNFQISTLEILWCDGCRRTTLVDENGVIINWQNSDPK